MRQRALPIALIALTWLVLGVPHGVGAEEDNDHDLARDLYEGGEIKSLSDILGVVRTAEPGDVVAVDLVRVAGRWTYRFQIVTSGGKRKTVDVDAATATLEPAPPGNP